MGSHFKDSYMVEIECMEAKSKLIRELMKLLMNTEKHENNMHREYIEKCYRIIYEHIKKQWAYIDQEGRDDELNTR